MVPLKRYFLYIEAPSLTICPYDINPMKMQNRQNLKCHFACPRTSASINLIHYRFVIRLSCLADSKSRYFQLNSEALGLFIFVIDGLWWATRWGVYELGWPNLETDPAKGLDWVRRRSAYELHLD